jgi:RNA polymerase sigma factor (sigma-70 family)
MALGRSRPLPLRRARIDPEAFAEFYDEHARRLVVFFARRLLDGEVALDLTAETFVQAFASRASFRGGSDQESQAWLFTIAHRQLSSYLRKGYVDRRARERLGVELGVPAPEELARVEELADVGRLRTLVADGLRRLSDEQRAAVELRVVDELPYDEVARRLQISEPTARARVSRGLRVLRAVMADTAADPRGGA